MEIGETILEVVEQFKYLGCQDSASATLTAEIIKRKMAMLQAFGRYRGRILKNPHVEPRARLEFFKAFIVPNATYSCEAWNYTKQEVARLERTCI